ncbi:hypothetical protein U1Q18_009418 [Sarracenia purpurea var. burkii]
MEVGWLTGMPSQGEEIWVLRLKEIELKKVWIWIELFVAENADLGLLDLVIQILMERMLAKLVDAVTESLNLDLD